MDVRQIIGVNVDMIPFEAAHVPGRSDSIKTRPLPRDAVDSGLVLVALLVTKAILVANDELIFGHSRLWIAAR